MEEEKETASVRLCAALIPTGNTSLRSSSSRTTVEIQLSCFGVNVSTTNPFSCPCRQIPTFRHGPSRPIQTYKGLTYLR